jgi:hypothetical protein
MKIENLKNQTFGISRKLAETPHASRAEVEFLLHFIELVDSRRTGQTLESWDINTCSLVHFYILYCTYISRTLNATYKN